MCTSIRCMLVDGCGKVPQATPSGGTPTSSSLDHPARAFLHGPMSCTHLDTQCVALPETWDSSGREKTGLGRQEPCDNSFLPFPCIYLQIFLAAVEGQNGSHQPHGLCPCSLNALQDALLPPHSSQQAMATSSLWTE